MDHEAVVGYRGVNLPSIHRSAEHCSLYPM
jgi:hypothetical protein